MCTVRIEHSTQKRCRPSADNHHVGRCGLMLLLMLTVLTIAVSGCGAQRVRDYFPKEGIYVCTSSTDDREFRFDSLDPRTELWEGTRSRITFFDINSRSIVVLEESTNDHICSLVTE